MKQGFIVSFLGYHVLQRYESVAWVFIAILLIVHWAQAAKYFPEDITYHELQGKDYAGVGLTYFAIIFGQCVSWASIAADYYVHYPVDVSKAMVFGLTWLGQIIPALFIGLLGVYLGGAILTNVELAATYTEGGIGAIILGTMHPVGYAKFVGIIYALAFSESSPTPRRSREGMLTKINSFQHFCCSVLDRPQHSGLW